MPSTTPKLLRVSMLRNVSDSKADRSLPTCRSRLLKSRCRRSSRRDARNSAGVLAKASKAITGS